MCACVRVCAFEVGSVVMPRNVLESVQRLPDGLSLANHLLLARARLGWLSRVGSCTTNGQGRSLHTAQPIASMAADAPPLAYLRGPTVVYELEDTETAIGRNEDNDIVSSGAAPTTAVNGAICC